MPILQFFFACFLREDIHVILACFCNNRQNVINDMEQYSRREGLEYRGIAEDPQYEKDTNDIVVKVAGLMGVEIDEQEFQSVTDSQSQNILTPRLL